MAERIGLPIRLEPLYLSGELARFRRDSIDAIGYYGRRKMVRYANVIEKILLEDTRKFSRAFCAAGTNVKTIGPDGFELLPCVHAEGESNKPGSLPVCGSCTDWSYLLPSRKPPVEWPQEGVYVS